MPYLVFSKAMHLILYKLGIWELNNSWSVIYNLYVIQLLIKMLDSVQMIPVWYTVVVTLCGKTNGGIVI